MERKLISFDWAIKRILRDKANFDILEGFLSELLHEEVAIVEIIESESNKESGTDKSNRVDLLAKDSKGALILIEVQYEREFDFFHRILYGSSRLITQFIKEGEAYGKIKKVITVSIVYFELGRGEDYLYRGTTQFVGVHKKDILRLTKGQQKLFNLTEVEEIFPENYIIRIGKFDENKEMEELFDEWVYFLKTGEIKEGFKAKNIVLAKKRLSILNLGEEERRAYESYMENLRYERSLVESALFDGKEEGMKEGMAKGIEEGMEKGVNKTKREAIVKLYKRANMQAETIAEVLEIEVDFVRNVLKEEGPDS